MKTKKLFLYLPILTLFVRLWMIFVLPRIGNFDPIADFNSSGYHHWEIGLGLVAVGYFARYAKDAAKFSLFIIAAGAALVLDEYTFLLKLFGFRVPYKYLSPADTLVLLIILAGVFLLYFSRMMMKMKRRK